MSKRYAYLLSVFFLLAYSVKSQLPDSLINKIDFNNKVNIGLSTEGSKNKMFSNDTKWLFVNSDKAQLKYGKRDELNYYVVAGNSSLLYNTKGESLHSSNQGIFDTEFDGISWYKCYFKVPLANSFKVYQIEFLLHGAVEVYLDGVLQNTIGKISSDALLADEKNITNGSIYFPITDTAVHCIAIRFGLPNYKKYLNKYEGILQEPSFNISIPEMQKSSHTMSGIYFNITNMLSAFFLSLFIIHFLIYFFYREQSFNLLYSLFLILLSLTFLETYLIQFIEDLKFYLWLENIDDVIFPTVCFILVTLLNKLLKEKVSWHYKFLIALLIYHYFDVIFLGKFAQYTKITIVMYTYFNTLAHSIKGVRRNIVSAKFLGWGILSCTLSMLLLIAVSLALVFLNRNMVNGDIMLFIFGFLIIVSVLSIPISMSAYLAYDFAGTNKSLSNKLIEVEQLSLKTMEQEREKQRILSTQNEVLEIQVKERTHEIEEQKKVIEEKNKDITDSINYAQRIQKSILPTEAEIKSIFPEALVLFKPRDVVSGDFYQFKRKDDYKFAIMADCTGHGVPGALMSMIGSNLLHQIILERGIIKPNLILSELHKEVKRTLRQTEGVSSHDGMDISIAMCFQQKIYLSSANRPVYLMHHNELKEVKPTKHSIGGASTADEVDFELHEIDILKGQMLYMFSDGYADQFGGEAGKKFKVKSLVSLLLSVHQKSLTEQNSVLIDAFDNWKGALEQVDDVTLIGIKL